MGGWVYAFETPSMPGVVKLGATTRDPVERLNEANTCSTWRLPEAYKIAWAANVDAPFMSMCLTSHGRTRAMCARAASE